ncbi:MAG: DUF1573 domain-containing protein [Dehalococcoidales bacterium]|nr:DUF1573 domain-containing protein [Dehalococcoidales bacterium]
MINKKISVYTDIKENPYELKIVGTVLATPDKLRSKIGVLNLDSRHIPVGEIMDTTSRRDSIKIENTATEDIIFDFSEVPEYLTVHSEPEVLPPGTRGWLYVTFNASRRGDYGYLVDKLPLRYRVGEKELTGSITVTSTILEDFSYLDEKGRAAAPRIKFDTTQLDFGEIRPNQQKICTFSYRNTGGGELLIRSVKTSHDCELLSYDAPLTSGSEGKMIFRVEARIPLDKFIKQITVISNDPVSAVTILTIQGKISVN